IKTLCANVNPRRKFFQYSWKRKGLVFGYHRFGTLDRTNPPKSATNLDTIQSEITNGLIDEAKEDLSEIYGGEWASLFATEAADEDFVESYKLTTLSDATASASYQLKQLWISLPSGSQINMLDYLLSASNAKLYDKQQWISKCFQSAQ